METQTPTFLEFKWPIIKINTYYIKVCNMSVSYFICACLEHSSAWGQARIELFKAISPRVIKKFSKIYIST